MSLKKLQQRFYQPTISHGVETKTLLFGTPYFATIYHGGCAIQHIDDPALRHFLRFDDIVPLESITVFSNAITRECSIEGIGRFGFFRYVVRVEDSGIFFVPQKNIGSMSFDESPFLGQNKERYQIIPLQTTPSSKKMPFLYLGCNKVPLLNRMRSKPFFEEIAPLLALCAPSQNIAAKSATFLGVIQDEILHKRSKQIRSMIESVWTIYMSGNCVLKRYDDLFTGYKLPFFQEELSLFDGLSSLAYTVRSIFCHEEPQMIHLIPCLPKETLSGCCVDFLLNRGHHISFEWSRGKIRRVLIEAHSDDILFFNCGATECRLMQLQAGRRKKTHLLTEGMVVKGKERYLVDQFCYT